MTNVLIKGYRAIREVWCSRSVESFGAEIKWEICIPYI